MVSHCTGQDKVWPTEFPMTWTNLSSLDSGSAVPHWPILQENSTEISYLGLDSSLRLEDLFLPYHPSPNATLQSKKVSHWMLGLGKTMKNIWLMAASTPGVHLHCVKYFTAIFALNLPIILSGHCKALFKHEYHSSSSGKNRDSGRLLSSLSFLVHPRMPKSLI